VRRGLITGVLGRILLGAGVLIFLFVAYQLWGTSIAESHSQSVLRQQLDNQLHRAGEHPAATTTTTKPPSPTSSTTTTKPPSPTSSTTSSSPGSSTTTTNPSEGSPTVGPTITAPNDGNPVGILTIAKIGLSKVIVQGDSTDDLQRGPGHYPGTPLPGEQGNAAIAGHRTTYGAPFYNLDELASGNLIQVQTVQGLFTYEVTTTQVVSPSDTAVVDNTSTPQLTLTTCNPRFSASTRLVVHARLINRPPAPTALAPKAPPRSRPHPGTGAAASSNDLAGGSHDNLTPVIGLGLLSAVVIAAMFVVARRRRRWTQRWLVYAVGGAASLVALFFFFGAVSPLLPASF
jgi:sortase A